MDDLGTVSQHITCSPASTRFTDELHPFWSESENHVPTLTLAKYSFTTSCWDMCWESCAATDEVLARTNTPDTSRSSLQEPDEAFSSLAV